MGAKNLPKQLDDALRLGVQNIVDPGDGQTISWQSISHAICELSSSGAETRVIESAEGYAVGQELLLVVRSYGGDIVISSDDDDHTLSGNGQAVLYVVVLNDGVKEWRVFTSSPSSAGLSEPLSLTENIVLNDNFVSNDGGDEGLRIDNDGIVYLTSNAGELSTSSMHVLSTLGRIRAGISLYHDNNGSFPVNKSQVEFFGGQILPSPVGLQDTSVGTSTTSPLSVEAIPSSSYLLNPLTGEFIVNSTDQTGLLGITFDEL